MYTPTAKQKNEKQMHIHINTVVAVYAKATERKGDTYFEQHHNLPGGRNFPPNNMVHPEIKTRKKHKPKHGH